MAHTEAPLPHAPKGTAIPDPKFEEDYEPVAKKNNLPRSS